MATTPPEKRFKDRQWILNKDHQGYLSWDQIHAALLMDIRDELTRINMRLNCRETLAMPELLRKIAKNTTKPKRKPKAKP
jgi:hypothetical protein